MVMMVALNRYCMMLSDGDDGCLESIFHDVDGGDGGDGDGDDGCLELVLHDADGGDGDHGDVVVLNRHCIMQMVIMAMMLILDQYYMMMLTPVVKYYMIRSRYHI
jgi:hypothetical protein